MAINNLDEAKLQSQNNNFSGGYIQRNDFTSDYKPLNMQNRVEYVNHTLPHPDLVAYQREQARRQQELYDEFIRSQQFGPNKGYCTSGVDNVAQAAESINGVKFARDAELNEMVVYEQPYLGNDDPFFSPMGVGNSKYDEQYPDYRLYVYTSGQLGSLEVMYPNNIVTPVNSRPYLHRDMYGKFKTEQHGVTSNGVYIIEYFSIRSIPNDPRMADRFFNYYINSNVVLNGSKQVKDSLIAFATAKAQSHSVYGPRDYFRIITFVPQSAFMSKEAVFVRHAGLVIGYDLVDHCVHPFSKEAAYLTSKQAKEVKNYIEISIVDNKNRNSYYIKTGNRVVQLASEVNLSKPEGVVCSIVRNNNIIDTKYCYLHEVTELLGIYHTAEEADYNGDLIRIKEQQIEDRRLETKLAAAEIALQKSNNDLVKANLEIEKIKVENERLHIDKERIEKEKEKLAAENTKILYTSELEHVKFKYDKKRFNNEMMKLNREENLEQVKFVNSVTKSVMEIKVLSEKVRLEQVKRVVEEHKYMYDIDKLERDENMSFLQYCVKIINLVGAVF